MVGLSMRDALDALKAAGLDLGSRRPRPSARPPGTILEQSIAAGTRVSRGSKVVLFYASVPPEPVAASVAVPSMVGMSMQDALTTLKKANLDLGSRRPKSSPRPPGTIVGQSIAPGTRVPPGSKVDLSYAAP
jgi:beta-lactam-binding protein with PASTA domain